LAAAESAQGKSTDALAKYGAVAQDRSVPPIMADFARLQTAMLSLDTASWDDLQARLSSLASDTNS